MTSRALNDKSAVRRSVVCLYVACHLTRVHRKHKAFLRFCTHFLCFFTFSLVTCSFLLSLILYVFPKRSRILVPCGKVTVSGLNVYTILSRARTKPNYFQR